MQGQKPASPKLHGFDDTTAILIVCTVSGKSSGNDLRMLPEQNIYTYVPSCHKLLFLCKKLFLKKDNKQKTTPDHHNKHAYNKTKHHIPKKPTPSNQTSTGRTSTAFLGNLFQHSAILKLESSLGISASFSENIILLIYLIRKPGDMTVEKTSNLTFQLNISKISSCLKTSKWTFCRTDIQRSCANKPCLQEPRIWSLALEKTPLDSLC